MNEEGSKVFSESWFSIRHVNLYGSFFILVMVLAHVEFPLQEVETMGGWDRLPYVTIQTGKVGFPESDSAIVPRSLITLTTKKQSSYKGSLDNARYRPWWIQLE